MVGILEKIKKERLYFDGGTGTVLQKMGLKAGEAPEIMNTRSPDAVRDLHIGYLRNGADIIKTNTFGINRLKYKDVKGELEKAVAIARDAVAQSGKEAYIAFDVGPTGRMLKPFGDLAFEDAVSVFAENMRYADELGADLILIETMGDISELKAAVIAAKENSSLPIFVTCAFGSDGKLLTGADACAVIALLEGMGVSAIGMNCSLGPRGMEKILGEFLKYSSLPIIVNPNAGLPNTVNGETVYDLDADGFADIMAHLADLGANILGGCCGTTPEYILKLKEKTRGSTYVLPEVKDITVVSSYTHAVRIGDVSKIVGERINTTGKPKLKDALRRADISYVLTIALEEEKNGAHILDVNVGMPEIDERETMLNVITALQSVTDLPLQIDTVNTDVMAAAMRIYSGKPLVNSVNGSEASMNAIFPLVRKYGGVLIALTMDENGIPENSDERVKIAERIARRASEYGISKKDIIFDPLVLTVASGKENANITLETVRKLKERGYKCSLGISNVSFGLPDREALNSAFYTAALFSGLDLAIINPSSEAMMRAYYSSLALCGLDEGFVAYTERASLSNSAVTVVNNASKNDTSLSYSIEKGLKDNAKAITSTLLETKTGLVIINEEIIPALNKVGKDFEDGKVYLPGLLMSAEAAIAAFSLIREKTPMMLNESNKKIVLATVKGDIHDIGKNIVKLIFESYGYTVTDLGKDVDKHTVLAAMQKNPGAILGLSALMTTTLDSMKETVELVRSAIPDAIIMVGGAVLTEEYATKIGADFYAPDALSGVKYAESVIK